MMWLRTMQQRVGVIDAGFNPASVLFLERACCHLFHYKSEHACTMRPRASNTMIGRQKANG